MINSTLFAMQNVSRKIVNNCKPTRIGRKGTTQCQHSRYMHVTRTRKDQLREVQKNEFQRQPAPHLPGQPGQPLPGDPPVPVGRNYIVGGLVTSFVVGVYSYTVYQMKKQNEMDFLDDIDNEVQAKK